MSRKRVLMVCSWLDHRSNVGVFFLEHAVCLSKEFDFHLVSFSEVNFKGFLNPFSLFFYNQEIDYKENIKISYVPYVSFNSFGFKIKRLSKRVASWIFFNYLNRNSFKIDLIHAQSIFDAGIFSYYLSKFLDVPYIITEHNQLNFFGKEYLTQYLIHKIVKSASKRLVVSYEKIKQFASNGFYYDFHVVGNLVNDSYFNSIGVSRKTDVFQIVTVGAFSPIKDHKSMFRVLSLLDKESNCLKIEFIWIGYNSWGEECSSYVNQFISEYKFNNVKISLIPYLDRRDLSIIFKESDIFLFTSLAEGLPVSVIEALACGLPVVSTDCGGVDLIVDDSCGRIFQILDVEGISNFLISLIKNDYFFDHEIFSKRIIDKYGNNSWRSSFKKLYNEVLIGF